MRSVLGFLFLLCGAVGAYAQHSFQKLDVNPDGFSNPNRFISFKGKTYFAAEDTAHGAELWWTDGQSFGMVADIGPGNVGGFYPWCSWCYSEDFVVASDKLFFVARDPVYGMELYEYDGVNPPQLAAPLDTYANSGREYLAEMNGLVYFIGQSVDIFDNGIYSYNPATHQYKRVAAGNFSKLAAVGGRLMTTAQITGGSWRIFVYDPLTDKLLMAPEPDSGPGFDPPGNLFAYNNDLFFLMETFNKGVELYRFDGVNAPRQITDLAPGQLNSFPQAIHSAMAVWNNKLYLMATDGTPNNNNLQDLYSYDLQTENITKLWEMDAYTAPEDMLVYGGKIYFTTDSLWSAVEGLFMYDGNSVTTFPYPGQWYSEKPAEVTESYGKLYFADNEQSAWYQKELYVYVDSIALGVPEIKSELHAAVYPNPATSEATISFALKQAAKLNVQLMDMQGRVVYTTIQQCNAGKHEIVVPVKEMAAGMYMYTVADADGVVLGRGKVVKQ